MPGLFFSDATAGIRGRVRCNEQMTITLLLFASYADVLGASSLDMDLPHESTVGDLLSAIRARPGAERLPPSPLVAVNQRYADIESVVHDGDEVALIPPVAGG